MEQRTDQNPCKPVHKSFSFWPSVISGLAGGVVDTVCLYPPYGIKYRWERREAFKKEWFKPRELYRGAFPYAASMVPATMLQYAIDQNIERHLPKDAPCHMHASAAFLGGAVSSLAIAPMGNIIVTQQRKQLDARSAFQWLNSQYNFSRFYRGLPLLMVRDGIYSGGLFWGAQYLAYKLQSVSFLNNKETTCKIMSGIVVGTSCSLISHPLDAITTQLQDQEASKVDIWKTTKNIYQKHGVKGFYPGAMWRVAAIIGGVTLVSTVTEKTNHWINKHLDKSEKTPLNINNKPSRQGSPPPNVIRKF